MHVLIVTPDILNIKPQGTILATWIKSYKHHIIRYTCIWLYVTVAANLLWCAPRTIFRKIGSEIVHLNFDLKYMTGLIDCGCHRSVTRQTAITRVRSTGHS